MLVMISLVLQVGVRVEEEDMLTGARHHCCSAYLTFVSVMARPAPGRSAKPLPKITPASPHQREIFRAGQLSALHPSLSVPPPPFFTSPHPKQTSLAHDIVPSCVGASASPCFALSRPHLSVSASMEVTDAMFTRLLCIPCILLMSQRRRASQHSYA